MTGDDQLRQAVRSYIKEAVLHGRENAGKDIDYPVDFKTHELMALIRQDRRELLERLKAQVYEYGETDVALMEYHGELLNAIPISVIDAELQHGAGLEEADHE